MSHTKEPWSAQDVSGVGMIHAFDFRANAYPIFSKDSSAIDGQIVYCSPEDARRIVACVNACAGIPSEDLEVDNSTFIRMLKERSEDARDAARYRWLRHNSGYWIRCHQFGNVWGHEHKDADLDGLIDEQMRLDLGMQEQKPRFENVSCSQCGRDFGPGDNGFSHCENHKMTRGE